MKIKNRCILFIILKNYLKVIIRTVNAVGLELDRNIMSLNIPSKTLSTIHSGEKRES